MPIVFEGPVGAQADVNELEYISALHQTDPSGVRENGSIKDEDIVHYLMSRYGIAVTQEEVRETIIADLRVGGGDSDKNEELIDLMEIAAIMMIPTLLKAARVEALHGSLHENIVNPTPNLLRSVLNMILEDVSDHDMNMIRL
jgi:hypothetical protein